MKTNLYYSNTKYGAFTALLKNLQENYSKDTMNLFIVPDKFSLNAEKYIMEYLGISSTMNIFVTSLDKMSDEYCRKLNLTYLSKNGAIMLVQKILLDNFKELKIFNKSYLYGGFCEDLFNNIMLLKSCGVSPTQLKDSAQELDDLSKMKLTELSMIYSKYEEYLQDRFYDSANKLTIFKENLQFDEKLKNTNIYYGMFDDYTPQALSVIKELSKYTLSQNFGLLLNSNSNELYDDLATKKIELLFSKTKNVNKLSYNECFSVVKNAITKNIGTKNKGVIPLNNEVHFWKGNSVQEEIEFLAKKIKYSIQNENKRFKQFTLAVSNLDSLQAEIECIFDKYEIPYFLDCQTPLSELVICKFIFNILDAEHNFYQQKNILQILSSPFMEFENTEKQDFENYILANNIVEDKIFQKFIIDEKDTRFYEKSTKLNEIRESVCNILSFFKDKFSISTTIYDYCEVIKEFINNFSLREKIESYCEKLNDLDIMLLSKQTQQCLDAFINILEELQSIFGTTQTTLLHFYSILKIGCESINVASAPNSVDTVFIGDANTSIFSKNDYFFFVNCVENAFPISQNDCGLILDSEINSLREIVVEPTIKQINKKNLLNTISNIFLYQEECNFSYAINSLKKEEQKSSSFLNDFKELFVNNNEIANYIDINNYLKSNDKKARLIDNITPYSAIKNIYNFKNFLLQSISEQKNVNQLLYSLDKCKINVPISNNQNIKGKVANINKIIENKKSFSVSQIETYYNCPYLHFMKYILKVKENPQGILQAFDIGNFLHDIAETFYNSLIKKKILFYDDKDLEFVSDKIINEIENRDAYKRFFKNKDEDLLLMALEKEAHRMCKAFNEQNKVSEFIAKETEFSFSLPLKNLGQNVDIEFYGKVDRLDEFGKYFRIIDYKTGSDKFELSNLYYGKKLQLHLYAYMISKKYNKLACGIFYCPIKDEFYNESSPTKKEFYKFDGVMVADENLALAQDNTLNENNLKSAFIPIKFKKADLVQNGEYVFDARSKVCSKEDFIAQLNYSLLSYLQAINEIKAGNIEPSPYKAGNINACEYCKFAVACGFDENRGNHFRNCDAKRKYKEFFKELDNEINKKPKNSN